MDDPVIQGVTTANPVTTASTSTLSTPEAQVSYNASLVNSGHDRKIVGVPTTQQWVMAYLVISAYVVLFIVLVVAALISHSYLLFAGLPILARELSYAFRRIFDFLFHQ